MSLSAPQVSRSAFVTPVEIGAQPTDDTLTALAGVATAADQLIYATGSDAFAVTGLTSFARTILDDANAGAVRTTLGLVIGTDVLAPSGSGAALTGITGAQVANTPSGGVAATTIQAAIDELDSEKAPKNSPTFTGTVETAGLKVGSGGTVITTVRYTSAVLVAGTVTVSDAAILASTTIVPELRVTGGTPGALYVSSKTDGVGYTITSTSATDTSTVAVRITDF